MPSDQNTIDRLAELGVDPESILSGADIISGESEKASFAPKVEVQEPEQVEETEVDDDDYLDEMQVRDQYDRYPDRCIVGSPVSSQYNLSVKDDLEAWNKVQAGMMLAGTRSGNLLIQSTINFYNGSYYVYASVRKVKFERLIH